MVYLKYWVIRAISESYVKICKKCYSIVPAYARVLDGCFYKYTLLAKRLSFPFRIFVDLILLTALYISMLISQSELYLHIHFLNIHYQLTYISQVHKISKVGGWKIIKKWESRFLFLWILEFKDDKKEKQKLKNVSMHACVAVNRNGEVTYSVHVTFDAGGVIFLMPVKFSPLINTCRTHTHDLRLASYINFTEYGTRPRLFSVRGHSGTEITLILFPQIYF